MPIIRKTLDKIIVWFCVIVFAFMTVVGTYQIVTRYFFNSPSTISEELITYCFTWLSIVAAALVFGSRGHLCMSFVYSKFKGKKRVVLDVLSEVTIAAMSVLLLIYGGQYMVLSNMSQITASLGINMGFVYAVLPISGLFILIYNLLNIYDLFKLWNSPDINEYGQHDEDAL
ncbi:TRAP transporter small permease [Succinatimonas hippei]|uniref:TRAP transporter small permease n=1 Tax=Succinatimonas hippei TaxID=626938 RepID=UPI00255C59EC|nr:TRAP transporter small permease [Succinatimonas hippei]